MLYLLYPANAVITLACVGVLSYLWFKPNTCDNSKQIQVWLSSALVVAFIHIILLAILWYSNASEMFLLLTSIALIVTIGGLLNATGTCTIKPVVVAALVISIVILLMSLTSMFPSQIKRRKQMLQARLGNLVTRYQTRNVNRWTNAPVSFKRLKQQPTNTPTFTRKFTAVTDADEDAYFDAVEDEYGDAIED